MRLNTRASDVYVWSYFPERSHLFQRPLSKHTTGAYREICRETGQSLEVMTRETPSLEAVPRQNSGESAQTHDGTGIQRKSAKSGDFSARVSMIQKRDRALLRSLHLAKEQISTHEQENSKLRQENEVFRHQKSQLQLANACLKRRWHKTVMLIARSQTLLKKIEQELKDTCQDQRQKHYTAD